MAKSCYSFGKAVDEAVANIGRYPPELVTVQEVCRGDLYAADGWGKLAQAMADLYGSRHIWVDFTPARDRRTGGPYKACINGDEYGIALIHHDNGRDVHRGWYANQDRSVEQRAWTCSTIIKGRLTGCTTHLSIVGDIAMRECHELMEILATSSWVMPEIIISGDLNLASAAGKPDDVENCVPPGYEREGDGGLQQIFYTGNIRWVEGRHEPMPGTDHPLLYQRFQV
jgi:hypothetical protein